MSQMSGAGVKCKQLSGGTLLHAFQGKRVYQPIWQVIYVYCPPNPSALTRHSLGSEGSLSSRSSPSSNSMSSSSSSSGSQMLLSDGTYLTYHVAIHPQCTITYHKTPWKTQNHGRSPEEVLSSYRFPCVKVMDFMLKAGDTTTVLFLSKIKLMGWEKNNNFKPEILKSPDAQVVLGNGEIILRSREGLDNFDDMPVFNICDSSSSESDGNLALDNSKNDLSPEDDHFFGRSYRPEQRFADKENHDPVRYVESDLLVGVLAPLGPRGLDILCLCQKCNLLTHKVENKITSFKPSLKILQENLGEILKTGRFEEFCSCDDENEQFRKEFQNKCMVVNQESGAGLGGREGGKVQCILVSRDKVKEDLEDDESFKKPGMLMPEISLLPPGGRLGKVSSRVRLCEHCGVEDSMMTACRQCCKVWYCSPVCKKADTRQHSKVCRAYITIRRYKEQRYEFARKLREPEDGCATCGFWRDSLEPCNRCAKVSYCSYRCKDRAAEKHRPVCEAYLIVEAYRTKLLLARSQEVD